MVTFKRAGGGSVAENLFNMNKALVLNSNTAKRKKKELTFTLSALYHMSKLESPRRLSSSPQGDKGPPQSLAPPLLGKGSATDTLPLGPMGTHWFPPLLPPSPKAGKITKNV